MQRLQDAVKKVPDPHLFNRPPDSDIKKMPSSGKSALNSILHRMTGGFREKKQDPVKEDRGAPLLHRSDADISEQKVIDPSEESSFSVDHKSKEEVPAFLRRQAN